MVHILHITGLHVLLRDYMLLFNIYQTRGLFTAWIFKICSSSWSFLIDLLNYRNDILENGVLKIKSKQLFCGANKTFFFLKIDFYLETNLFLIIICSTYWTEKITVRDLVILKFMSNRKTLLKERVWEWKRKVLFSIHATLRSRRSNVALKYV